MNSQIHLTVRLHMRRFGGLMTTLARPANSSMAARAVVRSAFQEAISRWQTSEAVSPNRPYAESGNSLL